MLKYTTPTMQYFKQYFKYYFLGLLALVAVFVWLAVIAETRDGLTVAFLDVGQGDAIFIEAPNGNQILLDAGYGKKVLRQLGKVMPFYDRSVDVIIESHPDNDHVGGLPDVLNRYGVSAIIESGVESESPAYVTTEKIAQEKGIRKVLAKRGTKINLGDGVILEFLFPDRNPSGWETNDASLIARLTYGNTSFLLTGDSPASMENYLVSLGGKNLDSDILKLGHHGSRTSSTESFLGFVSPQYAVISVGADNRYGHPHTEILDRLKKLEIPFLRTDEQGMVKFKSDGESVVKL